MKPGDILFFKGHTLISKVIQFLTKSEYTHVAMALDSERIIEANAFIKTRIVKLTDEHDVYLVKRVPFLTDAQRQRIANYATQWVGKPYDYKSVLMWAIRLIFRVDFKNLVDDANIVYCTELIDRSYQSEGIDLVPERETGDVTPSILLESKILEEAGE